MGSARNGGDPLSDEVSLTRAALARLVTYYTRELTPEQFLRSGERAGVLPDMSGGAGVFEAVCVLSAVDLRRNGVTLSGRRRLLAGLPALRTEIEVGRGPWHLLLTPDGPEFLSADVDPTTVIAKRGGRGGCYSMPGGKWATDVRALAPDFRHGVPKMADCEY